MKSLKWLMVAGLMLVGNSRAEAWSYGGGTSSVQQQPAGSTLQGGGGVEGKNIVHVDDRGNVTVHRVNLVDDSYTVVLNGTAKSVMQQNDKGNFVQVNSFIYSDGQLARTEDVSGSVTFYENGRQTHTTSKMAVGDLEANAYGDSIRTYESAKYHYNDRGQMVKITGENDQGQKSETIYNYDGHVMKSVVSKSQVDGAWDPGTTTNFVGGRRDNVVSNDTGKVVSTFEYSGVKLSSSKNYDAVGGGYTGTTTFNGRGQAVQTTNHDGGIQSRMAYDDLNRIKANVTYEGDGQVIKHNFNTFGQHTYWQRTTEADVSNTFTDIAWGSSWDSSQRLVI